MSKAKIRMTAVVIMSIVYSINLISPINLIENVMFEVFKKSS